MKVGLLTFHRAVNYGAVLQAFALQTKLEQLGQTAEIVDYRCRKVEEAASPFTGFKTGEKLIVALKKLAFKTWKKIVFHSFFKQYIKLSRKVKSRNALEKIGGEYDVFIAGSDQIWNAGCSGADTVYFLDFVKDKQKKNSYAASFGSETLFDEDSLDYRSLLADFNQISVRERSAVQIVKEESGKDAIVTLDPTMLLSREEWKTVVANRPLKEKYIFVYYIREPKDLLEYANKLAAKTGYVVINAKSNIEFFKKCSPGDFLAWIYYSEYFVTNSFHGTVFSLLFEKKFVIELDNGINVNNRSKELLEMVGVDRTLVLDNIEAIDEAVDYLSVKRILAEEKQKSISFLKSALGI